MNRLVLIDGNSILNRAFYGIMGNKMLMTKDGKYTNAVYGFLAIFFKIIDDLNPEYIAVAFDLKAPTARHKLYEGYKATRKGMPDELAEQMPILKDILKAMNITIIEKEGYEADDILGTLSKRAEKEGLEVTILSGDRDTFQLASNHITIRIPRTKMGKTEVDDFDEAKVKEIYGIEPRQLIEVKGLQGDTSDNIPGVPGVGEKRALLLIQEYKNIDNIYQALEQGIETFRGKLRDNIADNKELAYLSRQLGTINLEVPIEQSIEDFKVVPWNSQKVLRIFKELNFNRFIERFNLKELEAGKEKEELFQIEQIEENKQEKIQELIEKIKEKKEINYYLATKTIDNPELIIKEEINSIAIYIPEEKKVYYIHFQTSQNFVKYFKEIYESEEIAKIGYKLSKDYILLKQIGITAQNIIYDPEIASYNIDPTNTKYTIEKLALQYLDLEIDEYLEEDGKEDQTNQMNLFEVMGENQEDLQKEVKRNSLYAYCIYELRKVTLEKLKETDSEELFSKIEMKVAQTLAKMQYIGIYVDKEELEEYGKQLREKIEVITKKIYEMAGEEFNINSTKQLGEILFDKLKLPAYKKNKNGYSTDVDVLEKLRKEHPIIEQILDYRQLMKLNSTYVIGIMPYINPKTNRIHSFFHQTITATGRISSTEPNLQNIPTRIEIGKQLRKVFKAKEGYLFIDADYSQIELRVLAHISKDEHMIEAFNHDEDIHKQAASKVLGIPIDKVTKEQRSDAKAVNFGIVYGISDFGLSEQLGISRKEAKQYIEQYLEKYSGIKAFMENIVEEAKEKGYVETLFHRRRYIPELKSNNYVVRQFGARAAMNTPIQGTAADIMKIAMIKVDERLKQENLDAAIVLQIHDELLIECKIEQKEQVKKVLEECMEQAVTLDVPLKVELSEANNWYEAK